MKAMLINAYGEDAVFEAAEVEKTDIKAENVLVAIAASSVNTVDTMIPRMSKELPLAPSTTAILGIDFAGTIEAIGEGVSAYSVGDDVYGCAGGLANLPGHFGGIHRGRQQLDFTQAEKLVLARSGSVAASSNYCLRR